MKLGEGGEAFFVFETSDDIPQSLQTSPVVSPTTSPRAVVADTALSSTLLEPDYLDLATDGSIERTTLSNPSGRPGFGIENPGQSETGLSDSLS
jgi:phosphatidate phosphatase LPIN